MVSNACDARSDENHDVLVVDVLVVDVLVVDALVAVVQFKAPSSSGFANSKQTTPKSTKGKVQWVGQ